ncbi:MAG TPA: hypothetical protein VEQ85_00100 [Lacipirellulaceae bacterium]|nr:hypothetical protein [Lacipirellulaceae bacterium]
MKRMLGLLLVAATAAPATAQITLDGTRDAGYGAALAVQTVETSFGDNQSEWNAGYGLIDGGNLYLMLTGNLQNNFNKLEIFIDSKAGGQAVFDSSGNDSASNMDGLRFDTGFTADYHIIARRGSSKFDVDFADLGAQTASGYFDVFGGADFGAGATGTGTNVNPLGVSYDGSNVAGVGGNAPNAANAAAALAVTTGLELRIPLSDLGYVGGPINVMVGQNGGSHDYWSNQFLGGLQAPSGSLGGDGNGNYINGPSGINMNNFAGNQYFTVGVPEPASAGIALLAALGLAAAGRKRQG